MEIKSGATPTIEKLFSLKPMILQTSFSNILSTVAVAHMLVQLNTLRRYPISLYASRKSLKSEIRETAPYLQLIQYAVLCVKYFIGMCNAGFVKFVLLE